MKIKSTFKIIISWSVAFLVLELGSRIIAYQPILISWTKIFKNGTFANNSNSNGMHEFWDNGITKYKFGEYGNRISSKNKSNSKGSNYEYLKDDCKYLVLGDSFSFGWLVDYENAFPTILENFFNISLNKKVSFINAATGGWGIANYVAYLEIYEEKLRELNIDGIIIFMNNTDASRAIDSPLYEIAIKNNKMKAKRTNKFYYSKQARIKKFLSNKYIIRIYNFTQRHSNLARILKNILLNGSIDINPNRDKKVEKKFLSKTINYETRKILPNKKIILKQSLIDLQKFSENLAPLNIIYTGVEIIDNLSLYNQYLFSSEGEQFLKNSKINFDFSTIQKSNLLTKNYKIKYDPHPNKKGHMLIAKNILESTSDNSIKMFISRTCK